MTLSLRPFDVDVLTTPTDLAGLPATTESVMSEILAALGQGCAAMPVSGEATALMHQTYALRVADRLQDWSAIRGVVLLNGVRLGQKAAGFARQRGHEQVSQSDLRRAMAVTRSAEDPDKPCPICPGPKKSN